MNKFTISEACPCGCNEIRVYSRRDFPNGLVMVQCLRCGRTGEVGVHYLKAILVKVAELWDKDRQTSKAPISDEDQAMLRWDLHRKGRV